MRLPYFLALAAPLLASMPLQAATTWPAGSREEYMTDCVTAASQNVAAKIAKEHCTCSADVLSREFKPDEIKKLMDKQSPPSADLRNRALTAVATCKTVK